MNELERKKKLLVVESEAYRELLKLEVRNIVIYARNARLKAMSLRSYAPALLLLLSLARSFRGKKRKDRHGWRRMGELLFVGWKSYKRFGPLLHGLWSGRREPDKTPDDEFMASRS